MTKQLASIGPVLPCSYNGAHILERPKRLKFRQGIGRQWAGHACGRDRVIVVQTNVPGLFSQRGGSGTFPCFGATGGKKGLLENFQKKKETAARAMSWPSYHGDFCHDAILAVAKVTVI